MQPHLDTMADLPPPDDVEGGHASGTDDEVPEGECGDCGQKFNEPDEDTGCAETRKSNPSLMIPSFFSFLAFSMELFNFHQTSFPLQGCC